MLIEHVKDKKGRKIGTVVAILHEPTGKVVLGWSKCNLKLDHFNKRMGRQIAIGRLKNRGILADTQFMKEAIHCARIPHSLHTHMRRMADRANKYYQTLDKPENLTNLKEG